MKTPDRSRHLDGYTSISCHHSDINTATCVLVTTACSVPTGSHVASDAVSPEGEHGAADATGRRVEIPSCVPLHRRVPAVVVTAGAAPRPCISAGPRVLRVPTMVWTGPFSMAVLCSLHTRRRRPRGFARMTHTCPLSTPSHRRDSPRWSSRPTTVPSTP